MPGVIRRVNDPDFPARALLCHRFSVHLVVVVSVVGEGVISVFVSCGRICWISDKDPFPGVVVC